MAFSTKAAASAIDRKKILLAICLSLFAVSITYRLLNPYRQARVAKLTHERGISQKESSPLPRESGNPPAGEARDVWVDLFQDPPQHSGAVQQNFFYRPPPPEPQANPGQEAALRPPEPAADPVVDKRLQVQEELSRFKWFGQMLGKHEKVVFLEKGKDILLLREGDKIDGKYLVKSITDKFLVIRAESIREDVRIELGRF